MQPRLAWCRHGPEFFFFSFFFFFFLPLFLFLSSFCLSVCLSVRRQSLLVRRRPAARLRPYGQNYRSVPFRSLGNHRLHRRPGYTVATFSGDPIGTYIVPSIPRRSVVACTCPPHSPPPPVQTHQIGGSFPQTLKSTKRPRPIQVRICQSIIRCHRSRPTLPSSRSTRPPATTCPYRSI